MTDHEMTAALAMVPELYRLLACPVAGASDVQQTSMSQYRAMSYLRNHPGSTLGELAAELGINPGSASDLVERLVTLNLIRRDTNSVDRRQIQLSLTETAEQRIELLRDTRRSQLTAVREQIGESKWDGFLTGLQSWIDVLNEANPRKPIMAQAVKDQSSE